MRPLLLAGRKSLGKAGSPVLIVAAALVLLCLVRASETTSAPKPLPTQSNSGALRIVSTVDMGGWYWLQWSNHENTTAFPPKTGMILWAYSNLAPPRYRGGEYQLPYTLLYWVPPGYQGDGREALICKVYGPQIPLDRR